MAAYEILLLNTAIPQIQAAQSGDTYVVPRDIAFSAALTLTAGTANGVPYLSSPGKVLTTGSVLTFDGTTLVSGSSGTTTKLVLQGGVQTSMAIKSSTGTSGFLIGRGYASDDANSFFLYDLATNQNRFYIDTTPNIFQYATAHVWNNAANSTEYMRLTSTGLGIGTNAPSDLFQLNRSSTTAVVQFITNTGGEARIGVENASGTGILSGAGAYDTVIRTKSGTGVSFGIGYSAPAMRLDSSGNLGLGVTPSAWASTPKAMQISRLALSGDTDSGAISHNAYYNAGWKYIASGAPATQYDQYAGMHRWFRSTSAQVIDTDPVFSQAMTLDANGKLLLGVTSGTGLSNSDFAMVNGGSIRFRNAANSAYLNMINVDSSNNLNFGVGGVPAAITFGISGIGETARITSGGYFKASDDGTYINATGSFHEVCQTSSGNYAFRVEHSTATTPLGIQVIYNGAAPNGTGSAFLYCQDNTPATRAEIRSNGGLANYQSNNVDLSDIRTKTDINPLASYWGKIAALEIVTYKYKDQTHDDLNIGVIAQQVEQVAPEFVDADGFGETPEDGVPLKTIYNKDLTFAAIKALQEAMARIEKLEAEVAALKGA